MEVSAVYHTAFVAYESQVLCILYFCAKAYLSLVVGEAVLDYWVVLSAILFNDLCDKGENELFGRNKQKSHRMIPLDSQVQNRLPFRFLGISSCSILLLADRMSSTSFLQISRGVLFNFID